MKYLRYVFLASTLGAAVEAVQAMFKNPQTATPEGLLMAVSPAVDGLSSVTGARIPMMLREAIATAVVNAVREYYRPKAK